jgi:plasmid stabilization system protein ParE
MRVVYTPTAARQIESQISYLMSQGADKAAAAAHQRIMSFIDEFLARFHSAQDRAAFPIEDE